MLILREAGTLLMSDLGHAGQSSECSGAIVRPAQVGGTVAGNALRLRSEALQREDAMIRTW